MSYLFTGNVMCFFLSSFEGMQNYAILPAEPRGLPLNLKLMPEYFRDLGYETHMIGKVTSLYWCS